MALNDLKGLQMSLCAYLINQLKSFEFISNHLESFNLRGDNISYTIKMQRYSKMNCPLLVSRYYRHRTLCTSLLTFCPSQLFSLDRTRRKYEMTSCLTFVSPEMEISWQAVMINVYDSYWTINLCIYCSYF